MSNASTATVSDAKKALKNICFGNINKSIFRQALIFALVQTNQTNQALN